MGYRTCGLDVVGPLRRRPESRLAARLDEIGRSGKFAPRFAELCGELAAYCVPETIQHDDLHMLNV